MAEQKNKIDFVSLSAIVIAIASIIISIWQASEERKHNRLSVKPKLEIVFRSDTNQNLRFEISNNGLGPAVIVANNCFLNGKKLTSRGIVSLFEATDSLNISEAVINFDIVQKGNTITAGDRKTLIEIDFKRYNGNLTMLDISRKLGFEIIYQSMYGEQDKAYFLHAQ